MFESYQMGQVGGEERDFLWKAVLKGKVPKNAHHVVVQGERPPALSD